jgi:ketosteroid isomerase-like protein
MAQEKSMKLPSLAVVLTLFIPCLSTAQSVEEQLKKLEMQWDDAGVKKDAAVYDRLLADDFTLTGPNGHLVTKAQFTAELKSGEDTVSSSALSDMKVRVYGDTAVVTYVEKAKETFKGQDVSGTSRWTDTWVKRGGSWQCVASHGSKVAHP